MNRAQNIDTYDGVCERSFHTVWYVLKCRDWSLNVFRFFRQIKNSTYRHIQMVYELIRLTWPTCKRFLPPEITLHGKFSIYLASFRFGVSFFLTVALSNGLYSFSTLHHENRFKNWFSISIEILFFIHFFSQHDSRTFSKSC